MTYFDIQEAVLQRWNDQPSRNRWLMHGSYLELVGSSLGGDRLPGNPPSEAYVAGLGLGVADPAKRGTQQQILEDLVSETYELLEKEKA